MLKGNVSVYFSAPSLELVKKYAQIIDDGIMQGNEAQGIFRGSTVPFPYVVDNPFSEKLKPGLSCNLALSVTDPRNRPVEYFVDSNKISFDQYQSNLTTIKCFPSKEEGITKVHIYLLNDLNVMNEETFEANISNK